MKHNWPDSTVTCIKNGQSGQLSFIAQHSSVQVCVLTRAWTKGDMKNGQPPIECMIFSSQPGHPPHISGCFLFGLCGFRGGEWRRWHKWVNKAAVEKKLHLPNTMYNYAPQSRGPYRQWLLLDLHVWLLRWPKKILHLTVSSWWALCLHLQLSSLFLGLE